jgi:hypothetical protein
MSYNPLDFSQYTPDWMASDAPDNDGPERIIARIEQETGTKLSDDERQQVIDDFRNGMKFDVAIGQDHTPAGNPLDFSTYTPDWSTPATKKAAQPAAPVLPVKKEDTPPAPEGFFAQRMDEMGQQLHEVGQIGETIVGGLEKSLGSALFRANDTDQANPLVQDATSTGALYKALLQGNGDQLVQTLKETPQETTARVTSGLMEDSRSHTQAGEDLRKAIEGRDWITREVGGGLIDAAQSPTSAVSLIGGPAATIGVADQYAQSYYQARTNGLSKNDAEIYAWSQAAPESISFIPAGKVLERVPGLGKLLKASAAKVEQGLVKKLTNPAIAAGVKAAKVIGGEAGEEGFTQALQDAANAGFAHADMGELSDFANTQAPKSLDEAVANIYRASRAGAVMGGVGGVIEGHGAAKEHGQKVEDRTDFVANIAEQKAEDILKPARLREGELNKRETNVDLDIQRELDRIAQERAKEDAFKQAEQDKAEKERAAQQQKEIEQEAGFRTIAAEASVKGKTRLDKYGPGNAEVVPINPPAEVTPEAVQAEREQAAEAERARLERVEMGQYEQRIRTRQNQIIKNAKAGEAKAEKKAKDAESQRQREITDRLLAENPDKTPAELAPLLKAAVEAPVETKAPPATPVAAKPVAAKPDRVVSKDDKEVDDLADKLGLNMEMADDGTSKPASETHKAKIREIVHGLVSHNTQATTDVQNLLLQGKLVLVPNAKAAGLPGGEGAKAGYHTGTGKLYIYTDKVNGKDVVGSMMAALHESTHAGQFNKRSGRTSLMEEMMGQGLNAVKQKILNAYGKNKIATMAVDKAVAAGDKAAARKPKEEMEAWTKRIADLELVPHFVSEAAKANTYGSLGGIVRQIKGAGRQYLRDKLGVNLDVTLDDLVHAASQTAGEIVKTDLKGTAEKTNLEMVGGETGTGYREALAGGHVYKGRVDQKNRYEFSDEGASIDRDALDKLAAGNTMPLQDVLKHPELYKQYPKLGTKMKINIDPNLKGRNEGYVNGNTISLNKNYLDTTKRTTATLVDTLLHEVQHGIQSEEGFVPGSSTRYFLPKQVMNVRNMAERKYQNSLRRFDLEKAIANMKAPARNQWLKSEALHNAGWANAQGELLTPEEASKERFIQNGYVPYVNNQDVEDQAEAVQKALSEYQTAKEEFEKANDVAYSTYQADYGEAEARTTSHRKNMSVEERRKKPLESQMKETGVPVENTIDSTKYLRDSGELRASQRSDNVSKIKDTNDFKPVSALRKAAADPRVEEIEGGGMDDGRVFIHLKKGYAFGKGYDTTHSKSVGNAAEVTDALKAIRVEQPDSLEMADEADGETKLPITRRIPAWVSHMFSSSSGTGKQIREVMEHAGSAPAEQRMIAEGTIGRYRRGVDKLARLRGMSPAALNDEIMAKLDAIDKKSNDYETNRNNFIAVAEQYGDAGEALIKVRDQVDALSLEMLRDRAKLVEQGVPLTPDEKETYQTIKNNRGRYAHRQFGIHMGREGKSYAKNLWDNYEKFVKANGGEVSPQVREDYETAARAIEKITEQLVIPDDAALAEMNAEDTRKLYSEWSENTNDEDIPLEDMKQELADKRDAMDPDGELMNKTAESIAKQILGLTEPTSLIAKYYRGGKLDRSILKERSNIAPEIRAFMGEIKDPAARLFATVAKQTEFIARNKMLMELRNLNEPAHIQPPGPAGRPEVKGMTKLADDAYGPLKNHYVSPNLAGVLSDQIEQLANFEQAVAMAAGRNGTALNRLMTNKTVEKWGKLVGFSKMAQIVYNPANFLFNLSGGWTTMLVNGNVNPTTAFKALKTAKDIVAYAKNPDNNTKEARRVTAAGVTDSAFVGEINAETYEELNKILREMQGKTPSTLLDFMKKTNLVAKETYAMMDVVYKIANFYHQADHVLPDYYKAAGIEKTQAEIDREAADIVNDTNITYKRAAPIIKNVERLGLTQFMTYFYETFRTQVNNFRQGVNELQRAKEAPTPEAARIMAAQGTKRLMGQMTYWTAVGMLARAAAHAVFGEDDDKERKLRALLPDYMQNQDFVQVGTDKDGDPILFNFSRIDPYGPMSDMLRTALNTEASTEKLMHDLYQLYVAPRLGARLYDAVATQVEGKSAKSPLVQQIFPEGYSNMLNSLDKAGINDRTTKSATNVGEAFLPGIAGSFSQSNLHPIIKTPWDSAAALMSYMGGRMYKVNSDKQLTTRAYEYKDMLTDQRKQVSDIFKDHPNMDAETLTHRLTALRNNEEVTFNKLREVYAGLEAAGKTPKQINKILKDTRVSAEVISDLQKNRFKFHSVSSDSINSYEQRELAQVKTLAEKKEIRQKWKDAKALLRVSNAQIKNEE